MPYALCPMPYALCPTHYAQLLSTVHNACAHVNAHAQAYAHAHVYDARVGAHQHGRNQARNATQCARAMRTHKNARIKGMRSQRACTAGEHVCVSTDARVHAYIRIQCINRMHQYMRTRHQASPRVACMPARERASNLLMAYGIHAQRPHACGTETAWVRARRCRTARIRSTPRMQILYPCGRPYTLHTLITYMHTLMHELV